MVGFRGGGNSDGVGSRVFSGGLLAPIEISSTPTNVSLGTVYCKLPPGTTITRAYAVLTFSKKVNSAGVVNDVDGLQYIKVLSPASGAAYVNALKLLDQTLHTAANATEGGTIIMGGDDTDTEFSSIMSEDGLYTFQWTASALTADTLTLYDVQMFIVVEFSL